jgi:hypothetical protein
MDCGIIQCTRESELDCEHGLCGVHCREGQVVNGTICNVHDSPSGPDSSVGSGDRGSSLEEGSGYGGSISGHDPIATLRAYVSERKVLEITSPLLFACPHSLTLYELQYQGRGIDLLIRKTDTYVSAHEYKFKDDCSLARHLQKMATDLLTCQALRRDPIALVSLLRLPLRLLFNCIHVRPKMGIAGSKTFMARVEDKEDIPDDFEPAMMAAGAAAARSQRERRWQPADFAQGIPTHPSPGGGNGGRNTYRGSGNRAGGRFGGRQSGRGQNQQWGGGAPLTSAAQAAASLAASPTGQIETIR